MAEYSIDLAEKFIETAELLLGQQDQTVEGARVVAYLSRVACELTLKALLEHAGLPVKQISKLKHDLSALLSQLGECYIPYQTYDGAERWVAATGIRGKVVDSRYADATIGKILEAEKAGASSYPNEIRYGESHTDYPPDLWVKTARAVKEWAEEHWEVLRSRPAAG